MRLDSRIKLNWTNLRLFFLGFARKIQNGFLLYAILFLLILFLIRNNFHWQLLDDGNVIEDRFFPPWSYWTNFYRMRIGIEFSGLGIFWGIIGLVTQKNLILIYSFLIFSYLFSIKLANDIFKLLNPKSVGLRYVTIFFLFFIPGGSEEFLSLVKQEKWSLLGIELVLLGYLRIKGGDPSAFKIFWVGSILGLMVGKETFIFYLLSLLCVSVFIDKTPLKSRFIKTQLFITVSFIVYRLFPSIFYQQDNLYTSQLLRPGFNTMTKLFVDYLIFEPFVFIPLALILSFMAIQTLYKKSFESIFLVVGLGLLLELLLLLNWAQINAYYASTIEFLSLLFVGILVSGPLSPRLHIKLLSMLLILPSLFLGVNTSVTRSQIVLLQHSSDAEAVKFILRNNSEGKNEVMFGSDTEMIGNINAQAILYGSKSIHAFNDTILEKCQEKLIAVPIGQPTNDRFKIRGLTWPTNDVQFSKIDLVYSNYEVVFSNVQSREYRMGMLYFPDWSYTTAKKPLLYGWKVIKIRCIQ